MSECMGVAITTHRMINIKFLLRLILPQSFPSYLFFIHLSKSQPKVGLQSRPRDCNPFYLYTCYFIFIQGSYPPHIYSLESRRKEKRILNSRPNLKTSTVPSLDHLKFCCNEEDNHPHCLCVKSQPFAYKQLSKCTNLGGREGIVVYECTSHPPNKKKSTPYRLWQIHLK